MKTKFTLMTAIAAIVLIGATAASASAQCGYGYAPRAYAPAYAPAYGGGYGYYHQGAAFHDRRDMYRDERAINRDRYDIYRDRAYGNRFDARMDRGRLDHAYRDLGHDRRDFRRDRW